MGNSFALHFDLSQGCTAKALNSALSALGSALHKKWTPPKALAFSQAAVSLNDIRATTVSLGLAPVTQSLCQRTLDILTRTYEDLNPAAPVSWNAETATRLLEQLLTFCEALTVLSPLAVTASRITLSFGHETDLNRDLLLLITRQIPIYEIGGIHTNCDILGLALLKACVHRFGPRGESALIQLATGTDASVCCRALWCEPTPIATRAIESEQRTLMAPLVRVSSLLGFNVHVHELVRRLLSVGGKMISTLPVHENAMTPRTELVVYMPQQHVNDAVEAMLVTGEASDVMTQLVEQHSLSRRLVSVPMGSGQKQSACRVTECLFGSHVVRVEPLQADLNTLVQQTGQSQEVVRSDVLAAWRKWQDNN